MVSNNLDLFYDENGAYETKEMGNELGFVVVSQRMWDAVRKPSHSEHTRRREVLLCRS